MTQSTEANFDVDIQVPYLVVMFRPTDSRYQFHFLIDGGDIREFGPISLFAEIRHAGATGDTGNYDPDAVRNMARAAALAELRKRGIPRGPKRNPG